MLSLTALASMYACTANATVNITHDTKLVVRFLFPCLTYGLTFCPVPFKVKVLVYFALRQCSVNTKIYGRLLIAKHRLTDGRGYVCIQLLILI